MQTCPYLLRCPTLFSGMYFQIRAYLTAVLRGKVLTLQFLTLEDETILTLLIIEKLQLKYCKQTILTIVSCTHSLTRILILEIFDMIIYTTWYKNKTVIEAQGTIHILCMQCIGLVDWRGLYTNSIWDIGSCQLTGILQYIRAFLMVGGKQGNRSAFEVCAESCPQPLDIANILH